MGGGRSMWAGWNKQHQAHSGLRERAVPTFHTATIPASAQNLSGPWGRVCMKPNAWDRVSSPHPTLQIAAY